MERWKTSLFDQILDLKSWTGFIEDCPTFVQGVTDQTATKSLIYIFTAIKFIHFKPFFAKWNDGELQIDIKSILTWALSVRC